MYFLVNYQKQSYKFRFYLLDVIINIDLHQAQAMNTFALRS